MQTLIEYLPLILFFAFYKFIDIYWATGVLIGATGLQVAYLYMKHKKVATRHWVFFGASLVLGSMTILFRDEHFIQWKLTFVYGTLALALIASRYIWKKNLVKSSMMSILENAIEGEQKIEVPKAVWDRLNLIWFAILTGIAVANIYVAYNYSLDFWVNFKVFGLAGITFVAILGTLVMLYKYFPDEE